jgi:uncharacterized protein (TIGR00730 family)
MAIIAVFGSSRRDVQSAFYAEAYELGGVLARAGHAVLTGGYAGSMGAVSRGAREAGGHVIGITCSIFDPAEGNQWLSEEVKTASLLERLQTMVVRSDGFVAVRGGIGTLSEVTLAWSLLQTRSITKSLVLLGSHWRPVVAAFVEHTDLGQSIAALATVVDAPAQVVAALATPPTPHCPPPLG